MSTNKINKLSFLSVILIIGFCVLSVNSIRCYTCNSHLDPGCFSLNSAEAIKTAKLYLTECKNRIDGHEAFCRKTVYSIEYLEHQRVIRGCGYLADHSIHFANTSDNCINADNEGYSEKICKCHSDSCNSGTFNAISINLLIFAILSIVLKNIL